MDEFIDASGKAKSVSPTNLLPIVSPYADSNLTAVPAGSTNGTKLDTALARPANSTGVELLLPTGSSITYTIATAQPGSAPSATNTVAATDFASWTIPLGPNTSVYVTSVTGAVTFRWL